MRNNCKSILIILLLLMGILLMYAQESSLEQFLLESPELISEQIRLEKDLLRQTAKEFLVDELQELIALNPDKASELLDEFASSLNYLSDNEVAYLMGHFFAQIGEIDRAISAFTELLGTEFDEPARQMLGYMFHALITDLLEKGEDGLAQRYLDAVLSYELSGDDQLLGYLYLFSDIELGNPDAINILKNVTSTYYTVAQEFLPAKASVLGRLDEIDWERFYNDETLDSYDEYSAIIRQIKGDLAALNSEMLALPNILYRNNISTANKEESLRLQAILDAMMEYAQVAILAEEKKGAAEYWLETIRQSIAKYDEIISLFELNLQNKVDAYLKGESSDPKLYLGDLYLEGLIQSDYTIETYTHIAEIISELLTLNLDEEKQQFFSEELAHIQTEKERAIATRQRYYDSIRFGSVDEKAVFDEVYRAYVELKEDEEQLTLVTDEIEDYIQRYMFHGLQIALKRQISAKVNTNLAALKAEDGLSSMVNDSYAQALKQLDFITLKMQYRLTMAEYGEFLNEQIKLSDEALMEGQITHRQQQIEMIEQIEQFIEEYPNFESIFQPSGYALANEADLHYMLAELKYYAYPAEIELALEEYRRSLALDKDFPDRDLALYNIAFISSVLKQSEIDQNKIEYRMNARGDQAPPANSIYSEANLREALTALKEIEEKYPNSKVYEEAVYRLGLLNFSFARDSSDPEPYHAEATRYFDRIIANPRSPLYYEALYQRGWVRLNSFDEDVLRSAMNDFMEILLATDSGLIADEQLALDYRQDAVDNIAYCLIALDGTDFYSKTKGVDELKRVFKDYDNQQIVQQIIDGAVRNKLNLSAPSQAIDLLELSLTAAPLNLNNPVILDSILVLYHNSSQPLRDGQTLDGLTQEIYQRLINDYNHNSKWYEVNKNQDLSKQTEIITNAYEQRRIRLYNNFASDISRQTLSSYNLFMEDYKEYAKLHNENFSAFVAEMDSTLAYNYAVLANRSRNTEDFIRSINELYKYNDNYPNNFVFLDNEELALSYARNAYVQTVDALDMGEALPDEATLKNKDEAFDFLNAALTRYRGVVEREEYGTPENLVNAYTMVLLMGDLQVEREKLNEAMALYTQALEREDILTTNQKLDTYLKMADLSSRVGKYTESENWFRKALPLARNREEEANIKQDILVQIQNLFDVANQDGDYLTEAQERLRLAREMGAERSAEALGQKNAAIEAFKMAGAYQDAIDLLMELAAAENSIDVVYAHYSRAIQIAEDAEMMNDPAKAAELEQSFMDRFPHSSFTFHLRLAKVAKLAQEGQNEAAAQGYLSLFNEARAGQIDSDDIAHSSLLADAIIMTMRTGNIAEEYRLRHQFIELYPKHDDATLYLEYMVVGHKDRGEMDEFSRLAKELMKRDPSKNAYYKYIAELELKKIADRFDEKYLNKDYQGCFAVRDEYQTAQRAYEKEGLTFDNQAVYAVFDAVQSEYDEIQRRIAFLKKYDDRLSTFDKGEIFTKNADQHIRVVAITTWEANMNGGDRRIPKFNAKVNEEANKVVALIEEANKSGYFIDNDRRLRAINTIARIYQKGADILAQQIEKYFRVTYEGQQTVNYYGEHFPVMQQQFIYQFNEQLIAAALSWQKYAYDQYYLPGYENQYTEAAVEHLARYNQIFEYKSEDYLLDNSWNPTLSSGNPTTNIEVTTTPKNHKMGSLQLPAQDKLSLSKSLNLALQPDFAILQVIFPLDIEVKINGEPVLSNWVPIDTLRADAPVTTRYSYVLPGQYFTDGANTLSIEFDNDSSANLLTALSLRTYTSRARILANIPPVEHTIISTDKWTVLSVDSDSGDEVLNQAVIAENWQITADNLWDWNISSAKPIWVSEAEEMHSNLIFESKFTVDTQFIEGMIDLIAPESVTVYLNGVELGGAMFDYDPEPFTVYKSQVYIAPELVLEGENVLRFVVGNSSDYRGFMAGIKYTVTGKEEN